MVQENGNLVFLLMFLIIVLVCMIMKCKKNNYDESFKNNSKTPYHILPHNSKVNQYNNQTNKQPKKVKFNLNPKYKSYNPNTNMLENPYKTTQRQIRIKSCIKNHTKDYIPSKKQERGPVEYTNRKTHIGPQNNFHQCFANGTHNMKDLGWEHMAKDIRKLDNKKNLNRDNTDNPVIRNYLDNMKYQNLENVYF